MANAKFSFLSEIHEGVSKIATASKNGGVKIKRGDLKKVLEDAFMKGAVAAAGGERARFPVVGALVRREVKARKGGEGVNPFTGEKVMLKPRAASKKPRWSFPKTLKEVFANKKYW